MALGRAVLLPSIVLLLLSYCNILSGFLGEDGTCVCVCVVCVVGRVVGLLSCVFLYVRHRYFDCSKGKIIIIVILILGGDGGHYLKKIQI